MTNVLITGARAPIAIDLARSFAQAGWTPHLADSIRPWSARLSRVAGRRLHRFAPPRFRFADFTAGLARLVETLDVTLVVPTCEEVFYVAEAGVRAGFSDRVFAPAPALLRTLHSKVEFAKLACRAGLAAPVTRRITSQAGVVPWLPMSSQLVFKPEFSRFASHALVRPDRRTAAGVWPTTEAPWAVQDFVAGEERCMWSAAIAGEIVAFAAYAPRWRMGRSAGYYFEADRDPALFEAAQMIVRATHATGQLSFDVIRQNDGTIVPIECNPRGISGLHLFDGDARLARAIAGEGPLALPVAHARHLAAAMWVMGAPRAISTGRTAAFVRDLRRSHGVLPGAREPWLGLGALLDAGRFALVGMSRGRSASGQSTDDIEWNGEPIR